MLDPISATLRLIHGQALNLSPAVHLSRFIYLIMIPGIIGASPPYKPNYSSPIPIPRLSPSWSLTPPQSSASYTPPPPTLSITFRLQLHTYKFPLSFFPFSPILSTCLSHFSTHRFPLSGKLLLYPHLSLSLLPSYH